MYKINVYTADVEKNINLHETFDSSFEYYDEARVSMLEHMMEAVNTLAESACESALQSHFVPTMHCKKSDPKIVVNQKAYDGVIRISDTISSLHDEPWRMYEIEWVDESTVDKYNKMLKDTHGESLTLRICESEPDCIRDDDEECDGNCEGCPYFKPQYYYEGATCGRSDMYNTPEEAYEEADDYMNNIDLYVD